MGNRSGAPGMQAHRRRMSASKRASQLASKPTPSPPVVKDEPPRNCLCFRFATIAPRFRRGHPFRDREAATAAEADDDRQSPQDRDAQERRIHIPADHRCTPGRHDIFLTPGATRVSALLGILPSSGGSSNPFSELYASISGRGEAAAMDVKIFFPHARQPSGESMMLSVRKDATVEEVIGFALWSYWEQGWLPKLDEGVTGNDSTLSAVGWVMRIVEDDGEVDEDFPTLDRTGKMSKFNFEAFAIIAATPTQIQQNEQLESKIQCRPSRIVAAPGKAAALPGPGLAPPSVPVAEASSSSALHQVADTVDALHVSTMIPVSVAIYMQEALELLCRKRRLANPKDYALILNDPNILIYLDRTVASLEGKRELTLVKRSMRCYLSLTSSRRAGPLEQPTLM
ncbi:hypothetical protein ID866_11387, partial [Astraeus odoratus]